MALSRKHQRAIDRYEPITVQGITFYPITVEEYEDFGQCRAVLDFLPQRLPVALMGLPLLTALYRLNIVAAVLAMDGGPEKQQETEQAEGNGATYGVLFQQAALVLCLALRLGQGESPEKRLERVRPEFDPENLLDFKALVFESDFGEEIRITPSLFQRLRPILAAQNGMELPPENANPELVDADRYLRTANAPKLDYSLADLISWTAWKCGKEEREIYGWPIAKFERRAAVIERDMNYQIYSLAEKTGLVKFKDGNPFPHPCFKKPQGSAAMAPLAEAGKKAEAAVRSKLSEMEGKTTSKE